MTVIFLVINFMLSLLAIFFVIILYVKFSKVQQLEQDYHHLLKEAEETISGYVYELKEENEIFLSKITDKRHANAPTVKMARENLIDRTESEITQQDVEMLLNENEQKLSSDKKENFESLSLYEQVSHLVEKGHSLEDIAKKLNKGKTEIELLWKIRQ
ncbi:hypothetical protein [Sutcliffiella deserti]|uniref:hypothetical protein n=1 Tax=Sutcliffiella deserti TaxID=2875501 RepID=UPI001CBCA9F9|nr:hypothetical protein [Sutcliffiella deserti]